MDQSEASSSTFDNYDFTLKALFVFNPHAKPLNPKPSEQDIQDAKLIFYHPNETVIDEKRNQVGMAEGIFQFLDSFSPEQNNNDSGPKTHVIYQQRPDLYFFFTFTFPAKQPQTTSTPYYLPESHQFYLGTELDDGLRQVCENFILSYQIWCGPTDRIAQHMSMFITRWVHCYSRKTVEGQQILNVLGFQQAQFRFAPLESQLFLSLQYLNSMLHQLEPRIQESMMFYDGYFIFSSFQHRISVHFKDHYFGSGTPYQINEQKLTQKFKTHDINTSENAMMQFVNLRSVNEWKSVMPQKVYLPSQKNDNILIEYDYYTYLDRGLMILLFLQPTMEQQNIEGLKQVHTCIQRNTEQISSRLSNFIESGSQKQDQMRYIYYNGMNLAFKISNSIQVSKISQDYMRILSELNEKMLDKNFNKEIIRIGGIWFCGVKVLGRSLIVILQSAISLSRLEEELSKALDSSFPTIFL